MPACHANTYLMSSLEDNKTFLLGMKRTNNGAKFSWSRSIDRKRHFTPFHFKHRPMPSMNIRVVDFSAFQSKVVPINLELAFHRTIIISDNCNVKSSKKCKTGHSNVCSFCNGLKHIGQYKTH